MSLLSIFVRSGRAVGAKRQFDVRCVCDGLEPRTLMSAEFVYQELPGPFADREPIYVLRPAGESGPIKTIGSSVTAMGDIDGDGRDDFLVGAGGKTNNGNGRPAALAVLYSGATGLPIRTFTGTSSGFGSATANAGDVDGDGVNDVIIGSPLDHTGRNGNPRTGAAFVYSGKTGQLLHSFFGQADNDQLGTSVAGAGDLNGDGFADLLVGAPGRHNGRDPSPGHAYAYSGKDGVLLFTFTGANPADAMGFAVAGGGDVNDDGTPDIIVGSPGFAVGSRQTPGNVYVYSGKDGAKLFAFTGETERDLFGASVAFLGDINADGKDDFAVGSPFKDRRDDSWDYDPDDDTDGYGRTDSAAMANAGRVVIYSGDGSVIREIRGSRARDNFGAAIAGIPDVDFDGVPDYIIGAPSANTEGSATVYSGKTGDVLTVFNGRNTPLVDSDRLGTAVGAAGDVDGDGFVDFLLGATQDANPFKNDRGRVYVVSGISVAKLIPEGLNDGRDIWGKTGSQSFLILNGSLSLVKARAGFLAGDKVVSVNANDEVIGTNADGTESFLWKAGTRTKLADLITTFDGPAGTYTNNRAVDLTDSGLILVERTRDDAVTSVWLRDGGTLKFLFDGSAVALNEARTVVGLKTGADFTSLLWTQDAGVTEIADFKAVGINTGGTIVGIVKDTVDPTLTQVATRAAGVTTPIAGIAGGKNFEPTAINASGVIVGRYTIIDGNKTGGFRVEAGGAMLDIKPMVTQGDRRERFADSPDVELVAMNDAGVIAGRLDDLSVGYLLRPFDGAGPWGAGDTVVFSRDSDGDLHAATINAAGELIVYTFDETSGKWVAADVGGSTGSPIATDVTAYRDPLSGNSAFAASSAGGVLLFEQINGAWRIRNLTTEIPGATSITRGLTSFVGRRSDRAFIAGVDAAGDLVLYKQTSRANPSGGFAWTYENLSRDHLERLGLPTPEITGKVVSYVTEWDGLTIAWVDRSGDIRAVWTSPELGVWTESNLTSLTGGTPIVGGLTVFQTPWGAINLAGADREGRTAVTWWVPGMADWKKSNLTELTGGPELRAETMTSFTMPWGGMNVAGIDRSGKMMVYWWAPGMDAWKVADMGVGRLGGSTRALHTYSDDSGATSIAWSESDGYLRRLKWQPGEDRWTSEDISPWAT